MWYVRHLTTELPESSGTVPVEKIQILNLYKIYEIYKIYKIYESCQ